MTALRPRLIAITDAERLSEAVTVERAERLFASARPGAVMVQLRDRSLSARQRARLGRRLLELAHEHGQAVSVNDRLDLAALLAAHGVHLGEGGVSTDDARRILGACWISRACHDPARITELQGDAVLLSPIWAPRKGAEALGLAALERACALRTGRTPLVYALGAVTAENAAQCLAAGADGVAAIGAAFEHAEPERLLRALGVLR